METQDQILHAIFDQAAVGIAQIGLDGTWLRVNKRYCQMLGYSESELLTKTLKDITHPDDCGEVLDTRRQLLEGTISSHSMEKRYIRRDGTVFWGRLNRSVVRDEYNEPQFFIAVVEDISEKIEAERALRDSERRLRLALGTGVGLWEYDLRDARPALAPEYNRAFGGPPSSHTEWFSLVHPDDRDRVMTLVRDSIARASEWSTEFRVQGPDGRVRWLLSKGTVILGDDGRPSRMAGVSLDITERKQAEAALHESEDRFRNMADSAPVMIWIAGPDRLGTFFNKPWLDFRGRTLEQELGNGCIEGMHPDDREGSIAIYRAAFESRRPFQKECRMRRADGEYRWVLDNGVPLYRDGEFAGYIGSCIDVTEQKMIEERLRASEARLMSAQRLVKLGSWQRDGVTGETEFSDEMLQILGMPESPPKTLMEFLHYVHPEDREFVREGAMRVRVTGLPEAEEYRIVRADGEVRFVRSVLEALRDEHGAVLRVVGATQDITDFKRAQEESFIHQKLESIGTLANGIAHDFNNLLGGVLAQADLALGELEPGSNPEQELKAIRNAAVRGAEVVRQLMIYAGKDSDNRESVDVSQIVKEMLELLRVSVSKHATLEIDLGQDLPTVETNAGQIQQIVVNLIVNASEALGERDGVIRLTARHVAVGTESPAVKLDASADYVQLEVSDTGCGMSAETQARVFDPFFTTKSAGHGLGLAVVAGIVRSLHGKIDLSSEPGQGTTVQILLPCGRTAAVPDPMSPAEEAAHLSESATVLVVEDEEVLRQAVTKALRRSGFEVLEAFDGSAAIDVLRASGGKIDVILLDVTIPGASCHKVAAEYGQARPDAKVILTSAYSEEMVRSMLSGQQIRGFIRKPFHLVDLVKTLRSALTS